MIAKVIRKPIEYQYICSNCNHETGEPEIETYYMAFGGKKIHKVMNSYCRYCGSLLDWSFEDDSD